MKKHKRIAILFDGNLNDRKGQTNAILSRIQFLKARNEFDISVFMIQTYEPWYIRLLRHTKKYSKPDISDIDGISIRNLWFSFSLIDYILTVKLHRKSIFFPIFLSKLPTLFKDFDLISAHGYIGSIAVKVKKLYGIPYCVTWHGSDIHTAPFTTPWIKKNAAQIIENADMNFCVSSDLMRVSYKINPLGKRMVLYNGVDRQKFYHYNAGVCSVLRKDFGLSENKYHIASVGGVVEIKNPMSLPFIYEKINEKIPNIQFHLVGDGKLAESVKMKCESLGLDLRTWGNIDAEIMPNIYNMMDLIVMPSFNEGLPLTAVEALACGTLMVGSRVGGIPEVLGEDNTVPLHENFITQLAELCISKLQNKEEVHLPEKFDWGKTVQEESFQYNQIFSQKDHKYNEE